MSPNEFMAYCVSITAIILVIIETVKFIRWINEELGDGMSCCIIIGCSNQASFECKVLNDYRNYCTSHFIEWRKSTEDKYEYSYTLPKVDNSTI